MKTMLAALAIALSLMTQPVYGGQQSAPADQSYHPNTGLEVSREEIAAGPSFFDFMQEESPQEADAPLEEAAPELTTPEEDGEPEEIGAAEPEKPAEPPADGVPTPEEIAEEEAPLAEEVPLAEAVPLAAEPVPQEDLTAGILQSYGVTGEAAAAARDNEAVFLEIYRLAEGNAALSYAEKTAIYGDFDRILYNSRYSGYLDSFKQKIATLQITRLQGGGYIYAEYMVESNAIRYYLEGLKLSAASMQQVVNHEIKHVAQNNRRFCVLRNGRVEMVGLSEYLQSPQRVQRNGMHGIYGLAFHEVFLDQIYADNASFYGEIYRLYADKFGKDVIYESVYSPAGMSVLANRMIDAGAPPEKTVEILTRLDLYVHAKFYQSALEGTAYTDYRQLQQAVRADMRYLQGL